MALGGYLNYVSIRKIYIYFPFLSKETRDNKRRLCLDNTNNLFFQSSGSFILKQKQKELSTQATTTIPPRRQEG
jgi:hypothetical protein